MQGVKYFSKLVLAKIFPTVFNTNNKKKTHKVIFTILIGINSFKYFPFINKIKNKKD